MSRGNGRRAVITGMGVVTSIGQSVPAFRRSLFEGRCGIGPVSVFDVKGFASPNAGQVGAGDLEARFSRGRTRRASRCDVLGLAAADEAIRDSGPVIEEYGGERFGVILGGGAGGMLSWERFRRDLWQGVSRAGPAYLLASSPSTLADLLADKYHLKGTRATIATACSSSATSIGYAAELVRSGTHEAVLTGGSEALSELTFAGFHSLRLVDPEYCRPFDRKRRGLSLGEGAAVFVLEEYSRAAGRGAEIYGEVLGYAIGSDAFHMTSPDPRGLGMSRVMARALDNSGVAARDVDYINAHGTATEVNDSTETKAIKDVFGEKRAREIPVSSTKSMVGHCLGAAGAVEAAATVLALKEQIVPPTIHLDSPDPECDLDYVPNTSRECRVGIAMSNSFAFGGNNTALVLGRPS